MRNQFLNILFLILLFGQSCVKDESIIKDCTDDFLTHSNMTPFSGNEVSNCSFFVELYHYQGKQYYVLNSHCADIAFNAVDCDGNELCGTRNGNLCDNFQENAQFIRIVGISE